MANGDYIGQSEQYLETKRRFENSLHRLIRQMKVKLGRRRPVGSPADFPMPKPQRARWHTGVDKILGTFERIQNAFHRRALLEYLDARCDYFRQESNDSRFGLRKALVKTAALQGYGYRCTHETAEIHMQANALCFEALNAWKQANSEENLKRLLQAVIDAEFACQGGQCSASIIARKELKRLVDIGRLVLTQ
jgi:hypothetical protein